MGKPDCIHDNSYQHVRTCNGCNAKTDVWCDRCKSLLYVKNHDLSTNEIRVDICDDTYETYYTRKGRYVLILEAIASRGWEVPEHWLRTPGK